MMIERLSIPEQGGRDHEVREHRPADIPIEQFSAFTALLAKPIERVVMTVQVRDRKPDQVHLAFTDTVLQESLAVSWAWLQFHGLELPDPSTSAGVSFGNTVGELERTYAGLRDPKNITMPSHILLREAFARKDRVDFTTEFAQLIDLPDNSTGNNLYSAMYGASASLRVMRLLCETRGGAPLDANIGYSLTEMQRGFDSLPTKNATG